MLIPGCSRRVIEILFAEVGWDLSAFPDAAHLASWVGICPGNNESGGKRFSGRIRKGNRWVKAILVQAAQAAARTKNTYLSAQYHQIAARRGTKRAAVAVGHSILVLSYHMLTTGEPYREKGADYFSELDRQHAERRLDFAAGATGIPGDSDPCPDCLSLRGYNVVLLIDEVL